LWNVLLSGVLLGMLLPLLQKLPRLLLWSLCLMLLLLHLLMRLKWGLLLLLLLMKLDRGLMVLRLACVLLSFELQHAVLLRLLRVELHLLRIRSGLSKRHLLLMSLRLLLWLHLNRRREGLLPWIHLLRRLLPDWL
jgi:hypothetical protein